MGFLEKRREAKEERETNKTLKDEKEKEDYKRFLDEHNIPLRFFVQLNPKKAQLAQVKINIILSNVALLRPGFSSVAVDDKGIFFNNEVSKRGDSDKDLRKELEKEFGYLSNTNNKSLKDLEFYLDGLNHSGNKLDKKYDKYYKVERNYKSAIQYMINFNKEDLALTKDALHFGAIGKLKEVISSFGKVFLIMEDEHEKNPKKTPFIAVHFKHKEEELQFVKTLRSILKDREDINFRVKSEDKAEAKAEDKKMKDEMRR